jgi:hypothetical protein
MPIIGKLIKKTTEIGYKRNFNKGKQYADQLNTLKYLIEKAKRTKFGTRYSFDQILEGEELVEAYQKVVPVMDYDEIYSGWLNRSIQGEKDNLWPGRVRHYALSSGTTGSPSKRLPVTTQMIRSFQRTSMKQLSTLHNLDLPEEFFTASFLVVGGSSNLTKMENHIEGDLSGILKKYTSFVVSPFTKPGRKITKVKDWNDKLNLIVEKAPDWNIGIIAGIPSWCILLMERVVEKYQVDNIHDIWPNFQVYVHGGVFMDPYIPRLEKVIGKKVHLLDTYLASEGYFAYQTKSESKGMQLLLSAGIFFEFIPFNSDFFDDLGQVRDKFQAFTLSQVTEGLDYAMVISTNAGLWRYMIGDLVRFTNVLEREIIITGRIKQFLSLSGEHLSLDNINIAISEVSQSSNIAVSEFCIYADTLAQRHVWFIGSTNSVDKIELIHAIDKKLSELNDDYKSCRKYNLNEPEVHMLDPTVFYNFLAKIGKSGAQNKFPRVLNTDQAEKWLNYLETEKLF